jgi:methylmalonyl-CoA/ethylmalonyl-CoA epimerase
MIIDHICFAVKDIDRAVQHWEEVFGYSQLTAKIINNRQKVNVVFLRKNASIDVKLIEPLSDNISLNKFIIKGGSLHHVCFKCNDLNEEVDYLHKKGLKVLVLPEPGEAFKNHNIAFLWSKFLSNIELVDTSEKAGLIKH